MVKININNKKFSEEGRFVLWDWDKSDEPYVRDFQAKICFFIKDINPEKTLERMFLDPMKSFKFSSGLNSEMEFKGNVSKTVLKYLFVSYTAPSFPEFNWSKYKTCAKRDSNLSELRNEEDVMKYLSKYIDN